MNEKSLRSADLAHLFDTAYFLVYT